jgi:hypothetical protein
LQIDVVEGWIEVWWGLKLSKFLGPYFKKGTQNYEYKIRYKTEYLFRAPLGAPEGNRASEGALKLKFY